MGTKAPDNKRWTCMFIYVVWQLTHTGAPLNLSVEVKGPLNSEPRVIHEAGSHLEAQSTSPSPLPPGFLGVSASAHMQMQQLPPLVWRLHGNRPAQPMWELSLATPHSFHRAIFRILFQPCLKFTLTSPLN